MTMDTADNDQSEPRPSKGGPVAFFREVRAEAKKVTWATRQEVIVSTIMVVIMGVAAALFFFVVDFIVGNVIKLLLGIGS
jgi:preprotein translocase subunit SecE